MAKSNGLHWSEERLAEFERSRAKARQSSRTLANVALAPTPPAPSKYGNNKVEVAGIKHDSKKEARRWGELRQLERAGQISDLKRQVSFELAPAVHLAGEARKKPALRYYADATYMLGGQLVVEDTKSDPTRKTAIYRAKKHLMATVHNIHIREV